METEDLDCVQSSGKAGEVFLKFSKKLLQNPLTNARKCDIINKSHEQAASKRWSLKIEQQEID